VRQVLGVTDPDFDYLAVYLHLAQLIAQDNELQ